MKDTSKQPLETTPSDAQDVKLLSAWATPEPQPRQSNFSRKPLIAGFCVGLVLAVLGTTVYLRLHALGTFSQISVANAAVTKSSLPQLDQSLQKTLGAVNYRLISPDGTSKSYTPNQAGISYDIPATTATATERLDKMPFWQRLRWWHKEDVEPVIKVDDAQLATFIEHEATQIVEPSVNATLEVVDGEVITTPSKEGTAYQLDNARDSLLAAARTGRSQDFRQVSQTHKPAVSHDDVKAIKAQIEKTLEQPVSFTIEDETYSPTPATIGSWVEPITSDSKKANLEFNSGSIEEYLTDISSPYVQLPRSQIKLTNPDGTETVLVRGHGGSDIRDKHEIATATAKSLLASQPIEQALEIDEAEFASVSAQDYPKWLLVDITNKRMAAYEKGRLIRSFNVSAGAPATPTVLGEYKIYAKVRKQDMRGQNTDGSSYFQANVEWVNYFHGSYAIHGNYWRPTSWFGNINSSHGCVGIQNGDARWIYEWAPVNTPVIVHL